MMPNHVGDDSIRFNCAFCYMEIVFETCRDCGYAQTIPFRWQGAFTCGRCGAKCDIPRQRLYSTSTRAIGVKGYGYMYPKL
jgi:hypothetical protein